MKKKFRKRRFYLIRPADSLLPLAFLAGELFGPADLKGWLFGGWFAVRLMSLFTADGVRMAFATQPGVKKVRGSTTLAFLMQIIGAGIAAGLYYLVFHGITPFTLSIIGTGLMLNIEHVFCEYLRAEGDSDSADLCSILTAVFLFAGIMLEGPGVPVFALCLSGLGALIAFLMAVVTAGYRPWTLNAQVFRHIPRALIYGIAYPAFAVGALLAVKAAYGNDASGAEKIWSEYGGKIGFFVGLAVIHMVRTPFRRSGFEMRGLKPVIYTIISLCAVAAGVALSTGGVPVHTARGILNACAVLTACVIVIIILWANFRREE